MNNPCRACVALTSIPRLPSVGPRPPRGLAGPPAEGPGPPGGGPPAPHWATAAAAVGPGGGRGQRGKGRGGGEGGDRLGLGHIQILYKAPEDYTKPQETIQRHEKIIQGPRNTIQGHNIIINKTINIRQTLKIFDKSSNKYEFDI